MKQPKPAYRCVSSTRWDGLLGVIGCLLMLSLGVCLLLQGWNWFLGLWVACFLCLLAMAIRWAWLPNRVWVFEVQAGSLVFGEQPDLRRVAMDEMRKVVIRCEPSDVTGNGCTLALHLKSGETVMVPRHQMNGRKVGRLLMDAGVSVVFVEG